MSQSFFRFFIHQHYGDYHYHLTIKIIFCWKTNEIQKAKFSRKLAIFRSLSIERKKVKIGILKLSYLICVFTALLWSRFRSNRGRGQESNKQIGGQGNRGQGRGNLGQGRGNTGTQGNRGRRQSRGGRGQGRGGRGQGNQSQLSNINGSSSPSTSRNLQQVGSSYRAAFAWNIFVKYQRV